jgi:hypothetical protein
MEGIGGVLVLLIIAVVTGMYYICVEIVRLRDHLDNSFDKIAKALDQGERVGGAGCGIAYELRRNTDAIHTLRECISQKRWGSGGGTSK